MDQLLGAFQTIRGNNVGDISRAFTLHFATELQSIGSEAHKMS
ncbi:hypothetical protein OAG60_02695 [bacterium]|nr:hypothetical protein [bacterium]